MEPLSQRVPACPVSTNSLANRCPSPADKIFSRFPSLYGWWKDRLKLPASLQFAFPSLDQSKRNKNIRHFAYVSSI